MPSSIEDLITKGVNHYSFYQPEKPADEQGDVSRGFEKAMRQIPQTAGGAAALVGDLVGSDGLKDYGLGVYKKQEEAIQKITKPSDSFSSVLEGEGSPIDFLQSGIGYVGGQALTALATGGAGGFIGAQLAKQGAKQAIARGVAEQVAAQSVKRGAIMGAGTAAFGSNLMQEAGSIYPEALQQAETEGRTLDGMDKARIVGSSLAAAGVDTAMEGVMAGRLLHGGRKAGESMVRAAGREVPLAMAREGATEGIQTGIERFGAGQDLTTADAIRDYVDSAALGALGGGLGGGASVLNAQKVPEAGPLSRAANAGLESQILQLTHDPDPMIAYPDGSVGTKKQMATYLASLPPEQRQAEELRLKGIDPETGKSSIDTLSEEDKQKAPAQPEAKFSTPEDADKLVKGWASQHDPEPLAKAQAMLSAPGVKGDGLMIAPHPAGGGYTVIPSKYLSLDQQVQYADLQKAQPKEKPAAGAPTGSFSKVSELADLVAQEKEDLAKRHADLIERDRLRRDSDLAAADGRVEAQDRIRAANQRAAVLDAVLTDPSVKNPAGKFAAELKRSGYADTAVKPEELARIERHAALTHAFSQPDVIPAAPNEMPVESLVKEKKPKGPAGQPKPKEVASAKLNDAADRVLGGTDRTVSGTGPDSAGGMGSDAQLGVDVSRSGGPVLPGSTGTVGPKDSSGELILTAKGEPFKAKVAAINKQRALGTDSHEVISVPGGYAVKPKDVASANGSQMAEGSAKVGTSELVPVEAAPVAEGGIPTTTQDTAKLTELRATLKDIMQMRREQGKPEDPGHREKLDELNAALGEEAAPAPKAKPAPVDMTGWSEPAKAAHALNEEHRKGGSTMTPAQRRGFVARVREAARRTPDNDAKAQFYLDALDTRLGLTDIETGRGGLEYGTKVEVEKPTPPKPKNGPRERMQRDNPFKAFLGEHGISTEDRADTGADAGRQGSRLIPGYGPAYRKAGKRLDELASLAHEAGFLSKSDMEDATDNGGVRKLADLIERALHRDEKILPAGAHEVSAEQEADDRANMELRDEANRLGIDGYQDMDPDALYDAVRAKHAEAIAAESESEHYLAEEDAAALDEAGISDEELNALARIAANEQKVDDEELAAHHARESIRTAQEHDAGTSGAGDPGTQAAAGREGSRPSGNVQAASEGFGLTGESADEARTRIAAEEKAAKDAAKADRDAKEADRAAQAKKEIAARQDASAENFQLGQSAEDGLSGQADLLGRAVETDEDTGLPLNADGTVTVYHHTSAANAAKIEQTGRLKADAEPDVYVTTRKETDTGYGDTAVAIRVKPEQLQIDDEFPDGRKDFRLSVGKPGGSIKVQTGEGNVLGRDGSMSQVDPFDKAVLMDIAEGKSTNDILTRIAAESTNPQYRELAKALIAAKLKTTIEFGSSKGQKFAVKGIAAAQFAAGYKPKADQVLLFTPKGAVTSVLHELIHAATFKAIRSGGLAARQMTDLYEHVKKTGLLKGLYAMENLDEFVAESHSNPQIQNLLRDITAMPQGSAFRNAWDKFVAIVRSILGLKNATALDQVMQAGAALMQENAAIRASEQETLAGRSTEQAGETVLGSIGATLNGYISNKAEQRSAYLGEMSAAQETAARNIGAIVTPQSLAERFAQARSTFSKGFVQGVADQFAAIKDLDPKAYLLARMSKASDGTLEAAMMYGKPFLRDGVADVDIKDGGFAKVLASLDGEHDRFLLWVAAQRAERLKGEGKENLFTTSDISALKTLNVSDKRHPERAMKFAKALREMNAFNDSVLKVAQESGLLDQAAVDLFRDQPYVPFYRAMEDEGGVTGPTFSAGLVNQKAFQKLKGGSDKLNQDLLSNLLQNWSHLYSAAAKNRAAQATMKAAMPLGIVAEVPAGTKESVRVFQDGKAKSYTIDDPHLYQAVSAMEQATPKWFKPFSTFKRVLTTGVTINPTFKIRNLIRDSIAAIGTGDLSYNPLKNVSSGFKATAKDSQTYASMLASGGIIRFGNMLDGGTADVAHRLIAKGIDKNTILDESGFKRLQRMAMDVGHAYNELGDRLENVNRAALYEQMIAKGYSHADASFAARDLLDFTMQGRWPVIRFLTQSVPFMNARIQGLYKLGRAAKEDPRRMGYVVGGVALASLALLWAYGDDEDWKKREDFDRDNSWYFKIGNVAFRIPKPFEIGAVGTIAERAWELGTDKEMTASRFGKRAADIIFQQFALNPVPQIVKPLMDVYSNKDSFSARPIESMGMERLRPQDRVTDRTSNVARFLGAMGLPDISQLPMGRYAPLSPVQIDYLIKGYFGWMGMAALTATNYLTAPIDGRGEKPDLKLRDTFIAGNFVESLPSGSSRYVTQMYEQTREIEQSYASYHAALKSGDVDGAQKILADDGDKIRKYRQMEAEKKQVSQINVQIKRIEANKALSGEAKRMRIDALEQQRNQAARRMP